MSFVSQAVGSILGQGLGAGYQAADLDKQKNLVSDIQTAQQGLSPIQQNQNQLATMLQQQAAGQGPNLANAMLQQATNQNAAQAAGMMASQAGINPALAARAGATNLANAQQQAAQQASINRMNQQLQAQAGLGNLYNQQSGQNLQQQQILQNALAAQNSATNEQSGINQKMAQANAQNNAAAIGGIFNAGGTLGSLMGSGGGAASGGGGGSMLESAAPLMMLAYKGGTVPEHLHGFAHAAGYSTGGGTVPGKAAVKGDSVKNDKVPAMLSPNEIVLPRSVTTHPNAPEMARDFVAQELAKHGHDRAGKEDENEFKSALKRAAAGRKK